MKFRLTKLQSEMTKRPINNPIRNPTIIFSHEFHELHELTLSKYLFVRFCS